MTVRYLALPAGFNDWIEKYTNAFDLLATAVLKITDFDSLRNSVHAAETFRGSCSEDGQVFVLWNTDYWDATGGCSWAFISIDTDFGVARRPEFSPVVLTRAMKIASHRLAKRALPAHYRLRQHENNVKTCTAGPKDAYQYSLAFWEGEKRVAQSLRHAILVCGPDDGPTKQKVTDAQSAIIQACGKRSEDVSSLLNIADRVVQKSQLKSSCQHSAFLEFEKLTVMRFLDRSSIVEVPADTLPTLTVPIGDTSYHPISFRYEDWLKRNSPLTPEQRMILESGIIECQPLRINGPAGSGKTLLMQLLCIKQLLKFEERGTPRNILYVCHNSAMRESLIERFDQLGADRFIVDESLKIETLAYYCSTSLGLGESEIIDTDAAETKAYQADIVRSAITEKMGGSALDLQSLPLLSEFYRNSGLMDIFVELVVHEIGISIKGHNLMHDKRRYIDSDVPFSRLHGNLNRDERRFVFEVFENYYRQTTEDSGLLDADDLAITLLAKLHSPLWTIRRKSFGVDHLFVDETQMFNENERRIFAYLPKLDNKSTFLPIVLALDEAQELKGSVSSGFAVLGIPSIANEHLHNVYRSTPSILKLAFFLIQHTTDLFGVDFPDFTKEAKSLIPDDAPQARPPCLRVGGQSGSLGNYIAKRADALRRENLRSVCIVVHADRYWDDTVSAIRKVTGNDPYVIKRRGDVYGANRPGIVMARADQVGGQEFDAVLCVGLEDGIVPPVVQQEGFAESLRQRALREMYLVFTRARVRLEIIVNVNASVTSILQPAIRNGLLTVT